ncbi:type II toxin-antitoxin system VapC family toxin [Iodidimonas sp. SYSU 1G8]|uniref:type II toxin-antitoxin system VapC family toxin n=1 Tax=Iodidimonas sp. SYSU 1G8 TaxID=3133967 RepID=UPI0031FE91AD
MTDDKRLSSAATLVISDPNNERRASVVSLYELINKARLGKLPLAIALELEHHVAAAEIPWLPLEAGDMRLGGALDWDHKDPWDSLIVAQAIARSCKVVTSDRAFAHATVDIIW